MTKVGNASIEWMDLGCIQKVIFKIREMLGCLWKFSYEPKGAQQRESLRTTGIQYNNIGVQILYGEAWKWRAHYALERFKIVPDSTLYLLTEVQGNIDLRN